MEAPVKKRTIAKLYNLKSYIDGKIQEVDADLIEAEALGNGLALMVNRLCAELTPANP